LVKFNNFEEKSGSSQEFTLELNQEYFI
jgi:hypothetical protein